MSAATNRVVDVDSLAAVESERLTDGSVAWNVVLLKGEHNEVWIAAADEGHARRIADAIDSGAAWVQVQP